MGKKNRKKKNRNNGSSTGGTIHNNTIPDVATTTTLTTTLTIKRYTVKQLGFKKKQIKEINTIFGLKGYPLSKEFAKGYNQFDDEAAIASFIRGAKNVGCVGCMYFYADYQRKRGNIHVSLPFYLECAIRGHTPSISQLINGCYLKSKPVLAYALYSFWVKTMNELGGNGVSEEERKKYKKESLNSCIVCGKEDLEDRSLLQKCGKCKLYSYCGKECQRRDWFSNDHINECRQFMILKEFFKPRYVREIRDALMRGDNPKTMERLQTLRTKLGLTRPKEEYEELLVSLRSSSSSSNNDEAGVNNVNHRPNPDPYEYLVARRDGTVHIGSTSNVI